MTIETGKAISKSQGSGEDFCWKKRPFSGSQTIIGVLTFLILWLFLYKGNATMDERSEFVEIKELLIKAGFLKDNFGLVLKISPVIDGKPITTPLQHMEKSGENLPVTSLCLSMDTRNAQIGAQRLIASRFLSKKRRPLRS